MFRFTKVMLVVSSCALLWLGTATPCHATLIGYWKLDNDLTDSSGATGFDGTATGGPTYDTEGKFGQALSFDGVDDKVDVADDAKWDTGNTVTVTHWFNSDVASSDRMVIHDASDYKYMTYLNGTGKPQWFVDAGGKQNTASSTSYTDGNWHHFVGVYDKSDSSARLKLYVDGSLESSAAGTNNPLTAGDEGITFAYADTHYYTGLLDDIGIFSDALSEGEAKATYYLAEDTGLTYELGEANKLFVLHDAETGSTATGDGRKWYYTTGLTSTLGEVSKTGNEYSVKLDSDGSGVTTIPEPGTLVLLALGSMCLLVYRRWRRRTV